MNTKKSSVVTTTILRSFALLCLFAVGNVLYPITAAAAGYNTVYLNVSANNNDAGYAKVSKEGRLTFADLASADTLVQHQGFGISSTATAYLYAVANYGYQFVNFTENESVVGTTRQNQTFTLSSSWGFSTPANKTYNVVANFSRRAIELSTSNPDAYTYTWANGFGPITTTATFTEKYRLNEAVSLYSDPEGIGTFTDTTNYTESVGGNEDGSVVKPGTYTVNAKYTPPTLLTDLQTGVSTYKMNLTAEEVSNTATWTINMDLTPTFEFTSPTFTRIYGQDYNIQVGSYGNLPVGDVNYANQLYWTYTLTGKNLDAFELSTDANGYVIFDAAGKSPVTFKGGDGVYSATLTLIAHWIDKAGKDNTCSQTCMLLADTRSGNFAIKQNNVDYTGKTYTIDITEPNQSNISDVTFKITDIVGIATEKTTITIAGTIVANFTAKLTNTYDSFVLQGKNFTSAAVYTAKLTLTSPNTGTEGVCQKDVTIQVKRWYVPITITSSQITTNSVTLSWPESTFANNYILEQSADNGATWTKIDEGTNLLSKNVTGLGADQTYRYRVQVVTDKQTYTTDPITITTLIDTDNITPDTGWENAGVDFSAAFDINKKPIMDELYILDKVRNKCYIYDVKDDLSGYTKRETDLNPTTQRVGLINGKDASKFGGNKRVYVTGTCEVNEDFCTGGLFFNDPITTADPEAAMGWMQPVDCEVYLDNAKLQAGVLFLLDKNENYDLRFALTDNSDLSDYFWIQTVHRSASVFYLRDNNGNSSTTRFHLRGKNYLGGGLAGTTEIRIVVSAAMAGQSLGPWYSYCFIPQYSSPIAIKDASLFDKRTYVANGTVENGSNVKDWRKDSLRLDPYIVLDNDTNRIDVPRIICKIDTIWPVVKSTSTAAYLDLSARTAQYTDSANLAKSAVFNASSFYNTSGDQWRPLGMKNIFDNSGNDGADKFRRWITLVGNRYAPALYTGGQHGEFVIDGGCINLWPANGNMQDVYYYHYTEKLYGVIKMTAQITTGKSASYLVCGSNCFLKMLGEPSFDGTSLKGAGIDGTSILNGMLEKWKPAPTIVKYGLGDAFPVGKLVVNGGTITSNTDTKSFAYQYEGYTNGAKSPKQSTNAPNGQPLIGPNVEINGGTFINKIFTAKYDPANEVNDYAISDITPATKWDETFTTDFIGRVNSGDTEIYNAKGEELTRQPVTTTKENIDLSPYYITSFDTTAFAVAIQKSGFIVNAGTEKEYVYGLTNVHANGKDCYFYLPPTGGSFYKHYEVKAGETLSTWDKGTTPLVEYPTYQPYNLTVEEGGVISIDDDLDIAGYPIYKKTFKAADKEIYQTMAMPYEVARFYSPKRPTLQRADGTFNSYIEIDDADAAGVPEATRKDINNNHAYCYIYFLDNNGAQTGSAAPGKIFTDYYHSHPNGSLMQQGKTYVVRFPDTKETWMYEAPISFIGKKHQTIQNSKSSYSATARQALNDATTLQDDEFIMTGNYTFQPQTPILGATGEAFMIDVPSYGDDDYHRMKPTTFAPMQGYLLANEKTIPKYFVIGKRTILDTSNGNNTTTGLGNTSAEWTVYAHGGYIYVTPVADSTMMLYTVDGQLVGTYPMVSGAQTIIPAAAGMYILRSGDAVAKVMVE